jgi:SNF2 family DNA or RNA helicase
MEGHPSFVANGLLVHNTATPTYNYGDEIFRILDVLNPGCLGTASEFFQDWCSSYGRNRIVSDPSALGQSLVDRQLILRRRRRDVGRELPALNIIVEAVPYDAKRLEAIKEESVRLAKLALGGAFNEAGQAIRQLDLKMRQVTGIAKAPYVADFVKRLADSGEKVVLAGWHREVYAIWYNILGKRAVFYTGTESPAAKQVAVDAFTSGAADVFIISLRSGAGLDGLQKVASICVVGELDWSPEVHNQLAGRLNRDGQDDIVTLCYLVAQGGSDPLLASILNLKGEQAKGIRDPGDNGARDLFTGSAAITRDDTRGKLLAKAVLEGLKT